MGVAGNESTSKARRFAMITAGVGVGAIYDFSGSGAPTNGTSGTGNGFAGNGSIYTDYTTGYIWSNVGTEASPVWTPISAIAYAVTSANILAMNGAPVTLIPAPPAGYYIEVFSIVFEMIATATAYASGGAVSFPYHGGAVNTHSGTIPATTVNAGAAGTTLTQLGSPTAANGTVIPVATGVDITNATGAFTTGTGTAKVVFDYSVIKQ